MAELSLPVLPPEMLRPTPQAITASDPKAIETAAKDLESAFLAELIAPMFAALETDGLGGGGAGERMFRPMLIEQYARRLSEAGGIGVAEAVARELLAVQAAQTPPEAVR